VVFRDDSPASVEASLSREAVEIRKFGVEGIKEIVMDMMSCVFEVVCSLRSATCRNAGFGEKCGFELAIGFDGSFSRHVVVF
jgi:hypothetical protein